MNGDHQILYFKVLIGSKRIKSLICFNLLSFAKKSFFTTFELFYNQKSYKNLILLIFILNILINSNKANESRFILIVFFFYQIFVISFPFLIFLKLLNDYLHRIFFFELIDSNDKVSILIRNKNGITIGYFILKMGLNSQKCQLINFYIKTTIKNYYICSISIISLLSYLKQQNITNIECIVNNSEKAKVLENLGFNLCSTRGNNNFFFLKLKNHFNYNLKYIYEL